MIKGIDYTGIGIVFLCHDGQGNILFSKRSPAARDENGRWDIGGGALEFGDDVETTLKKEILEEYNGQVLGYEFLGYRDVHREKDGKKTHWVGLDFLVLVEKESIRNNEPKKFDEINWFTLNSLPSPLHSQLPYFFEKYKDRLRL